MPDILIIAAHPDDEILGCGGIVARHAAEGDSVHVLVIAEGATSREGAGASDVQHLRDATAKAADVLGAKPPRFLGLPDNRLDSIPLLDIIRKIETVVDEVKPSTVYTHHGGDLNKDHRIVHQAVVTACRPLPGSVVREIYGFETVSSTEWASPAMGAPFTPNRYVAIAAQMEKKLAALKCYVTEMRTFPHARSIEAIEALARMRGVQSGMAAAEAFETILHIKD